MKKTLTASLSALAIMGTAVFGQNQNAIEDTRNVVSEWVQVTTKTAQRTNEWARDKELIADRIEVLKDEKKRLEDEIASFDTDQTDASQARSELAAQEEELRQSLAIIKTNVGKFEQALREVYPYFPDALKANTDRLFKSIPAADAKSLPPETTRITLILGILNEFDKFNKQINKGSLTMDFEGGRLEVTTLMLGAGIGFYADNAGTHGGLLLPAKDGWKVEAKDEYAEQIARMIAVFNKTVNPAEFVSVPAQLTDVSGN